MKVAILGGSGFIGRYLSEHLIDKGHQVQIWTRSPEELDITGVEAVKWPLDEAKKHLDIDALVNLAGDTINQRWTPRAKHNILHSRVDTTYHIIEWIKKNRIAPKVLINGSAVGYYGMSKSKQFTEEHPPQSDFLSQVCAAWEKAAEQITMLGIRLVKVRFGLVLGNDGGALPKMLLPYRFYIGGKLGQGDQWVSWIHIADTVRVISFALENEMLEGSLNCTAPQPVKMNDFGKAIAKQLGKPHWIPTPAIALRLILGEMSNLILEGQYVHPEKLISHSFSFEYETIDKALHNLLSAGKAQESDDEFDHG